MVLKYRTCIKRGWVFPVLYVLFKTRTVVFIQCLLNHRFGNIWSLLISELCCLPSYVIPQNEQKMFEEILAGVLSLFSAFTLDTPRISRDKSNNNSDAEKPDEPVFFRNVAHCEYDLFEEQSDFYIPEIIGHTQVDEGELLILQVKPTIHQSLMRSLKVNLSITSSVFILAAIGIVFLYFDMRTFDLCFEWKNHNNTIPFAVMRFKLIGDCVEDILLFFWLAASLVVLFGWTEFKKHYVLTVFVGLLFGLLNVLYKTFLLLFNVYDTNIVYLVPGNVLFAANLIVGCLVVVRKVREAHPTVSYSDIQIMSVISVEFLTSFAIAMYYRCAAVPLFNSLNNETYKFIVATFTPLLTLLPTAICRHMALWRSSEIIEPQRSFVLVYFMRGSAITLYRIMQADFKNIWLFIGLSLFSGVSCVLRTATVNLRHRIWAIIIKLLKKTCCASLRQLPLSTPNYRRLKADTEIQNMLFESNTLIISQAYLVLYMIISFELSDWSVIKESFLRLAIGLSIEFFFNFLSIFLHIHWHNVPIPRVWWQFWRRHFMANAVIIVVIVCYFTRVLLTVFQVRMHNSQAYPIRNCSMPFENWR